MSDADIFLLIGLIGNAVLTVLALSVAGNAMRKITQVHEKVLDAHRQILDMRTEAQRMIDSGKVAIKALEQLAADFKTWRKGPTKY